jgi:hypothetical protein
MGAEMSLANSGRALTELGAVLEAAKMVPELQERISALEDDMTDRDELVLHSPGNVSTSIESFKDGELVVKAPLPDTLVV